MKITRSAEAELPHFSNHEEARDYFKNQYGNRFMMTDSRILDGVKTYFYHLVLDDQAYQDGIKKSQNGERVSDMDFLFSYQSVEITEDGQIHVIQ